jgi:hypothetical protein
MAQIGLNNLQFIHLCIRIYFWQLAQKRDTNFRMLIMQKNHLLTSLINGFSL